MNEERKKKLRRRYLHASRIINAALENTDCGLTLLRHFSPEVERASQEIAAIRAEVKEAMKQEAQG